MPRGKPPEPSGQTIIQQSMEEVIHSSMMPYAEFVILDRALPRVEDGLKPVQRRILYTMYELGNFPDRPHRKCARIVGDCLGKYHPHGDTSVYDAMVRMAQDFNMSAPLVDGHGNFGSIDGDSAAAMRYTEARMTPLSLELLRDIEKDTVPFSLNFDDSLKEPDVLPGRFPNLLVNGATGIAVGLATNIAPHNLGEVIDAVIAQIDNPKITVPELMRHIKAPDFPTGGLLLNTPEIQAAYETGRGKLLLRAKCAVEPGQSGRRLIVISELPFQTNKAALLEKILKLSEEKKGVLSGIHDIRDESDRTGMRAVIEVKKEADPDTILKVLYKYSGMQVTFGVNMVVIAEGKPQLLGLKQINRHYIDHQKQVVSRRTKFDLEAAQKREHILKGLMIALDHIDEVIRLIRASKTPKEAGEALIRRFAFSQAQAQAILEMRLQRLTNLEMLSLRREYEQVLRLIQQLTAILGSEKKLLKVIKDELMEIRKKYPQPRRTQMIDDVLEKSQPEELMKAVEDCVVMVNRGGYIRRMPKKNVQIPAPEKEEEIREPEMARMIYAARTDRRHLVFTTAGQAYFLDVEAVPEGKWKDRGALLSSLCGGWDKGEELLKILPADFSDGRELILYTAQGMVKAAKFAEYDIRKKSMQAIGLKQGDRLINVEFREEAGEVLCITELGMSIRFKGEEVPASGRTALGVKAISLQREDRVAFAAQTGQEGEVVLLSDRGYGKRTLAVDYDLQARNGKGLKTFDFKKNGSNGLKITAAFHVTDPVDFCVVQNNGEITRLSTEQFSIERRFSKGLPVVMALLGNNVEHICLPPERKDC